MSFDHGIKTRMAGLLTLGSFVIFGLLWTFIVLPFIVSSWFASLSPLIAYPFYSIGWILAISGGLGFLLHFSAHRIFNLPAALSAGFGSWLGVAFVYDLWAAPYYLSTTGQVLIPLGGQAGENVAVDSFAAVFWSTIWPSIIGTPTWYTLTYFVTSMLAVFAMFLFWLIGPLLFVWRRRMSRML